MNNYKKTSRTLQFIFIYSVLELYKDAKVKMQHSIGRWIYGEVYKDLPINDEDIQLIKAKMDSIIKSDMKIEKVKVKKLEAIDIFEKYNMMDKVNLLKQTKFNMVTLYKLGNRYDYFYGPMWESTGVIKKFDLKYYNEGFILAYPLGKNLDYIEEFKEQKKLTSIFKETEKWLNILEIGDVSSLNEKIYNDNLAEVLMIAEALHEKKIAEIADKIASKKDTKIVLIAGPSSSGKTTFANRLGIQLRVNGIHPIPISMDDFFVDRDETPVDENGEYDFEGIEAVDIKLFNRTLEKLLNGETVNLPTFDFLQGKKIWTGKETKLIKNSVIIIEGIHGLNPKLTSTINNKFLFKIYISALTQLNLDNHNRISTTDVRRVRRIVRDSLSRGKSAEETLLMWPKIKAGEEKNIFIYQEEADIMFNSTLAYELCVLKKYALKELDKVPESSKAFDEVKRLKGFLSFFADIDKDLVPENSLLREFIGGSIFYKY